MPADVFVSYSTEDGKYAETIARHLEANGIRCWYAPRDILPGQTWPAAISNAIKECRVMVLVFSERSNNSGQVARELNLASNNKRMNIIPFRIESVRPSQDAEYYLMNTQWLDALGGNWEDSLETLGHVVRLYVGPKADAPVPSAFPASAPAIPQALSPTGSAPQTERLAASVISAGQPVSERDRLLLAVEGLLDEISAITLAGDP